MVSNGQLFKKAIFSIRDQDRAPCAETGCFWDSQNELRCKNNGIRRETVRWTRKPGVFGNRKTNYVVKQRNWGGNRAAGAVSKWKAVRAAARCQKSVRKKQIGRARRHYPHGGEVTRQKLCAEKMCGGNSASRQPGNHIIGIPAASSATYGRRQCGDLYYRRFFIIIILS